MSVASRTTRDAPARTGAPRTGPPATSRKVGRERGQSTVEFALLLPLLAFGMLAIVQTALVVRDAVGVVHASREAARVASVEPDPRRAQERARQVLPGAQVEVDRRGEVGTPIGVEVRYRSRTDLPLVGRLFPDPTITARTEMRVER